MNKDLKSPVTNLESTATIQSNQTERLATPANEFSEKSDEKSDHSPRLWAAIYVCMVALQCFFILGFGAGSTSPMLSELSDEQDSHSPLRKKTNQDLFNVRDVP